MQEQMGSTGWRYRVAMLTLTYADIDGYSPRHITLCLKAIRSHLRRRGIRLHYVWVMELQKRGAPHYHVLIWLPRGLTLPKPDKRGWWSHGLTRIEWARNAVAYVAKYAGKFESRRALPKGARVCAVGGLTQGSANQRRWWLAPVWVRCLWDLGSNVHPSRRGGGWHNRDTGEWCASPFRIAYINGTLCILRV